MTRQAVWRKAAKNEHARKVVHPLENSITIITIRLRSQSRKRLSYREAVYLRARKDLSFLPSLTIAETRVTKRELLRASAFRLRIILNTEIKLQFHRRFSEFVWEYRRRIESRRRRSYAFGCRWHRRRAPERLPGKWRKIMHPVETNGWTNEQRRGEVRWDEARRVATGWRLRCYKSNDDVARGRVEYFIE